MQRQRLSQLLPLNQQNPLIPKYEIAIDENIQNGTIEIETESGIGSGGNKITWLADDNIPADAVEGVTNIFGNGKAVLNINGKRQQRRNIYFFGTLYNGIMLM